MLKINFPSSSGYIFLDPLFACENDTLRFEFMTQVPNGLLLYNGPIYDADAIDVPDFISFELQSGFPKLRINLGNGEVVLPPTGQAGLASLNDGYWHTIEVFRIGRVGNGYVGHHLVSFLYHKLLYNCTINTNALY